MYLRSNGTNVGSAVAGGDQQMTFTFEVWLFDGARTVSKVGEIVTTQEAADGAWQAARRIAKECWPDVVQAAELLLRSNYVRLIRVED